MHVCRRTCMRVRCTERRTHPNGMATQVKSKIPVAKAAPAAAAPAAPKMLATKPARKSAPGVPQKKEKKQKKRKRLQAESVYGCRPLVSRRAMKRCVQSVSGGIRVEQKLREFVDHFVRSKALEIVHSADSVTKLLDRRRIGPKQVVAAIQSVFRAAGEEFTTEGSYETQMIASALRAVADYEKAVEDKRKQVEQRGPREVVAKLRAIRKGRYKGVNIPFPVAKRVIPKEAAQFAAKNAELAKAMDDKEAHTALPSVTLGWASATAAAGLFIEAVRVFNFASEVCSDSVSITKTGAMALTGALNYLMTDVIDSAMQAMPKDSHTLMYRHLERSLVEISREKGVVMRDSDALKLMEPYLMRTPYMRKFAVEHYEPTWDFVLDMFPYDVPGKKKRKKKNGEAPEAAAVAAAEAPPMPVVAEAPPAKKPKKAAA